MNPRLFAAASLLIVPALTLASGADGFDDNAYVPVHHVPAPELEAYAGGRLGVVSGEYFRVHLVLGWRALHGAVLSPADVKNLHLNEWRVGDAGSDLDDGVDAWLKERALIAPSGDGGGRFGVEAAGRDYGSYVNCPRDAMQRASQTLRDRVQRYGAAAAKMWLAGQDAVFANCSPDTASGPQWKAAVPVLPAVAPADAPAWLQADRAYQMAAALFYSGRYGEARERFLAIAADKGSPWQPLGAYLGARCLIREATLMPSGRSDAAATLEAQRLLGQARRELQALSASDPAAMRLLGWVDARLRPAERADELAQSLQRGPLATAERVSMLNDYLRLMDDIDVSGVLAESAEPMTAWIGLMQATARFNPDAAQRAEAARLARQHWRKDGDAAWLMPLLAQARQLSELAPEELKAVREVPVSSAAWQTMNWHLARLDLVSSQAVQADAAIDAALADPTLAPSTRNRWLQLKLVSARSVEAMLAAAPRAIAEPGSSSGVPIPDEGKPAPATQGIDEDFAARIYRHLPLAQLTALIGRTDFPASLRTSHREVVFTRALLLEDWATADGLASEIAAPRSTTKHLYRRYLAATGSRDKKLAAALILVNTPELHPSAVSDAGLVRYWGCGAPLDGMASQAGVDPLLAVPVQYLSDAEQAQARRERAVVTGLPVRTRWLADALLKWAATKPNDPEAPKALALLVASTRMECPGFEPKPGTPNPSREAFDLLHSLWPRSEWAAKTKYWF